MSSQRPLPTMTSMCCGLSRDLRLIVAHVWSFKQCHPSARVWTVVAEATRATTSY